MNSESRSIGKRAGRGFLWLLLCLGLMGSLCGCGEKRLEKEPEPDRRITIGFTFDSFVIERWQREREVFLSAAAELGADVNVQSANGDLEEQIRQIDYFIQKNVDVILVVQVADDNGSVSDAIGRARKAGIPVIAYDRLVLDSDVDMYISFDNESVGKLMAEHMTDHIGEGDVLMIGGPLSDYNVIQIEKGYQDVLEAQGNRLRLAEKMHAPGWLAETGFSVTNLYLSLYDKPDGIVGGNDSIAGQAVKALAEQRLAGSVCVVGQDADLDACQRIVEGTQCMTVYKPVEKMAKRAAELAVALAQGEELTEITEMINDGSYNVPYCKIDPIAVTKDNMDEVITGKYHEAGDIYLNVDPEKKSE